MSIRELPDSMLAELRIRVTEFGDTETWRALSGFMVQEREKLMATLTDRTVPGEQLKFTQGELAQANRDIMLVERFLRAVGNEQQRRQRASERE